MGMDTSQFKTCRRNADIPLPEFIYGEVVALRIDPAFCGQVSMRRYQDGEWLYLVSRCSSRFIRESDLFSLEYEDGIDVENCQYFVLIVGVHFWDD